VEARGLKVGEIEPAHLLLGLCKIVDLDLTALVPKAAANRDEIVEELLREARRLRELFRAAELDPRIFRRRLRQTIHAGRFATGDSERLHRSNAAKEVFRNAERCAGLAGDAVLPVHLLYAVLIAKEEKRDGLLDELDVSKTRLQRLARDSFLSAGTRDQDGSEERRRRLN
jgi:ATP-dependent Clp protease ATP-binding subunit ClpC